MDKFNREPVIDVLWQKGEALNGGIRESITRHGLGDVVKIRGKAPWTVLDVADHPNARKEAIKTHLLSSLNTRGVLTVGVHSVCYAHTQADIETVHEAYDVALAKLRVDLEAIILKNVCRARLSSPCSRSVSLPLERTTAFKLAETGRSSRG